MELAFSFVSCIVMNSECIRIRSFRIMRISRENIGNLLEDDFDVVDMTVWDNEL